MIKKSIAILGILVFFLLMCSTVTATSGIIFANGGDGNSKISGNRIIREKNSFWIEMYSGSIRVNLRKYSAPCRLDMDSFKGFCMMVPLKGTTFLFILGFGGNIQVS